MPLKSVVVALTGFVAGLLAAQGCTSVEDREAEAEASSSAAAVASAPKQCPPGFTDALIAATGVSGVRQVRPQSLPLPPALTTKIVCAMRHDDETGAAVFAIMRADLSYKDMRHELWGADFDNRGSDYRYVRDGSARPGDVKGATTRTYRSFVQNARMDRAFNSFAQTFPDETQVATFLIKRKPRPPEPEPTIPPLDEVLGDLFPAGLGQWSCDWSPTMNDDWHDDVLCTGGDRQDRPYLLPGDSFITYDEIMRAAFAYEQDLNRS